MNKSPEIVLKEVASFFRKNKITYEEAAAALGYNSRQTLYNMLASKKYMSRAQASRFALAYPFNTEFLMKGEGELESVQSFRFDRNLESPLFPQNPTISRQLVIWLKNLTLILKDDDINELYEKIYRYVFYEDIYTKELIEAARSMKTDFKEVEASIRKELSEKILESFTKLNHKFKDGITPAAPQEHP